jgi:hypothetical protein
VCVQVGGNRRTSSVGYGMTWTSFQRLWHGRTVSKQARSNLRGPMKACSGHCARVERAMGAGGDAINRLDDEVCGVFVS